MIAVTFKTESEHKTSAVEEPILFKGDIYTTTDALVGKKNISAQNALFIDREIAAYIWLAKDVNDGSVPALIKKYLKQGTFALRAHTGNLPKEYMDIAWLQVGTFMYGSFNVWLSLRDDFPGRRMQGIRFLRIKRSAMPQGDNNALREIAVKAIYKELGIRPNFPATIDWTKKFICVKGYTFE